MKSSDLIFVGIKGFLIALNRSTGQQVWATHLKGGDFVNVVIQEGTVIATCYGEIFCLDAVTGKTVWHNPLKGYGRGLATIATEANQGDANLLTMAEKRRRDQQAASAAAVAAF